MVDFEYFFNKSKPEYCAKKVSSMHSYKRFTLSKLNIFHYFQLSPPNSGLRSLVAWHGIKRIEESKKRMAAADKAYELTEENFEIDAVREKLSTFRRKRLGMFSQKILHLLIDI